MIHYIKVENFHSIYGKSESNKFMFDLVARGKLGSEDNFYVSPSGNRISYSQSVLGENAGGKTNLLKAIGFLQYLILAKTSQSRELPYLSFANNNNDSLLEIAFESNEIYFEYKIEFNKHSVLSEVLKYKDYSNGNIKELYERKNEDSVVLVSSKDKFLQKEIDKLPSMPLWETYIAFVSGFNWNDNKYLKVFYEYFYDQVLTNIHINGDTGTNISYHGGNINIFEFYNDLEKRRWAIELFNRVNQSVKDLSVIKKSLDEREVEQVKKILKQEVSLDPVPVAMFTYDFNKEFSIEHYYESLGNRKLFDMIPALYKIFNENKNNVLVYDELDRSFHPELVYFIVSLFSDKEVNKTDSQIIFTSHCYSIINELSRHKITFISKNRASGETEIYKLADIEGSDNFSNPYQKYLNGSLGSYPVLRE